MNKSVFDSIAEEYNEQREKMDRGERYCFEIIKDYLYFYGIKPYSGVDLGIGSGYFMRMFLREYVNLKIVGVDISNPMLCEARNYLSEFINRVHLVCGDIRRMNFKNEKFDIVISSLTIHHLNDRDKKKVIKVVKKILKKGGLCIIWDKFTTSNKIDSLYHSIWKKRMMGQGITAEEIIKIEKRRRYDKLICLNRFIRMLERSGFVRVNTPYKDLGMSLIIGERGII
ncbi:MAG: class I SAM-dependent methyltransferase [Candidatus Hydrogenedentota bacterium]